MASAAGTSNHTMLRKANRAERVESSELTSISRGVRATGDGDRRHSPDSTSAGSSGSEPSTGGDGATDSTKPKTTRTRTVKCRNIFIPEDYTEKKTKGKGRKGKFVLEKRDLKTLLEDEQADMHGSAEGSRRHCRNESDGENRWDRIRAKVKRFLQKVRRDSHYIEVYQHDGWKSCGKEKLKPTIELHKAKERIKGVKAELRQVVKRLTEMNPDGSRWRNLKQDNEGNINVDEVVCSKCNKGDSDDNNDILLCDYAGCFRAFHQNCLSPAIKPEAFPSPSEDWFCWQCKCLTDCLQWIEDEVPGSKLRTWEDVYPDVEAGKGQASEKNQAVLLTDSDDSDDESFKGSSSESDNEDAGEGPGNKGMENDSDEEVSDTESMESDEVAKLQSEAGDMDMETEEVVEGDSRAGRALARRKLKNKALGLPDESVSTRGHVANLVSEEKIDASNIMNGRRARKRVDYVKLNEALFGNDEVYGDHEPSDPQRRETKRGSGKGRKEKKAPLGILSGNATRVGTGHHVDMNAGGKRKPSLKRKESSMSFGSSSAQEMPAKRRART